LKIWLKLIITGIIIFVVGSFIVSSYGMMSETGSVGLLASKIGHSMVMIGILVGIKPGFRRMMSE